MTKAPRRRHLVSSGLAAGVLLGAAGCAPTPASPAPPAPTPTSVSAAQLARLKQEAGIAACPASDVDEPAVDGGLPDVTLPCLGGGRPVRLAGLRGEPMVVNVWAQWCGPCREEAPHLAEVARDEKRPVAILGIDYDDPEPDWAIEFARLSGWRYPQVVGSRADLAAPLRLGGGPPQTLFVTAEGRITHRHVGPFSSAQQIRDLASRHLGVRW
ncbi:MAG: TlpA family protein disulfide reductase [Actinomycetes bacterium]